MASLAALVRQSDIAILPRHRRGTRPKDGWDNHSPYLWVRDRGTRKNGVARSSQNGFVCYIATSCLRRQGGDLIDCSPAAEPHNECSHIIQSIRLLEHRFGGVRLGL